MRRTRLILGLALAAAGLIAVGLYWRSRNARVARGPNVVLIVLDTTRADFLSCYGFAQPTTPRLDAIASDGTRFAEAFATDYWTLPSHASILTGLYPSEAGATSATLQLARRVETLAERFASAGYRTGATVQNPWLSRECGFDQGFQDYHELWKDPLNPTESGNGDNTLPVDSVCAWLSEVADDARPFFLFVNFNVPHLPYAPPARLRRRFYTQEWSQRRVRRITAVQDDVPHLAGAMPFSAADYALMRELYAAEIALVDEWVGMIDDALGKLALRNQTMLVITGDHGENIGERDAIGHQFSMYGTTLQVPLIIRLPGQTRARRVVKEPVSLVNLATTLLHACGLTVPADSPLAERHDLLALPDMQEALVFAEDDPSPSFVATIAERFPDFDAQGINRALRSVRTKRYRLIWKDGAAPELYDLWIDPGEERDRAAEEPEVVGELLNQLHNWREQTRVLQGVERTEIRDSETLERLRALGYIADSPPEEP